MIMVLFKLEVVKGHGGSRVLEVAGIELARIPSTKAGDSTGARNYPSKDALNKLHAPPLAEFVISILGTRHFRLRSSIGGY